MTTGLAEGPLTSAQAEAVLDLAAAARAADGVAPLSEQTILHVTRGPAPAAAGRDWLAIAEDGGIAGFAHLDAPDPASEGAALSGELVVHPAHRRRGHGTTLAAALAAGGGGHCVRVWAHGDLPVAAEFAKAMGFTRVRELWQMLLPSRDAPITEPTLPAGMTLRTFVPGSDEEAWLAVNRRAFADHPEQGGWTRADLEMRKDEPWFDPAGFFLAVFPRPSGELAGFHWTKVHPSGGTDGGPIGEVYVVGVDPAAQGTGLGKALTAVGLAHLRARGLAEIMLYVDGDNTAATRLYRTLGFRRWNTDVMYEKRC